MTGRGFGRSTTSNGFGGGTPRSSLSFTTPPPDISQVNDPGMVVAFKGLLKKNDTTLSKSLEEIRSFVKSQGGGDVDSSLISAWAQFYPRVSINNSRRVRELAHLVQYEVLAAGNSMIKDFLPIMVPSWLAGTFDKDTAVAKAAELGWKSLLDTPEKTKLVLKQSQPKILAYVQEGLEESPETLNDERTMSHDDLKATYQRLIGKCIDMVAHLMRALDEKDIQKYSSKYEALFKNSSFLDCTSSDDAHLRRSSIQLLGICLHRQSSFIKSNLKAISGALLADALSHTQLGSAYDLVETLRILTIKFPEVWVPAKSKSTKDPVARLRTFIEKGSQRGSAEYWNSLATLLLIMPKNILSHKLSTILELASAIRVGLRSREEPKGNLETAWAAYLKVVLEMTKNNLSDPDSQIRVVREAIFPAVRNFILMEPDRVAWSIETPNTARQFLESCATLTLDDTTGTEQIQSALKQELKSCAQQLEEGLFTSIPVDAINMKKLEDATGSRFARWFMVIKWVFTSSDLNAYLGGSIPEDESLIGMTESLIRLCTKAIEGRHGRAYGAALALMACIRTSPSFSAESHTVVELIRDCLEKNLFSLLETPSGEYLLGALKSLKACAGQADAFKNIWTATLRKILDMAPGERQRVFLALLLLKGDGAELAVEHDLLQQYIRESADEAIMEDDGPSWSVFHAAAASKSISDAAATKITDIMVIAFQFDSAIDRSLKALTWLTEKDLSILVSCRERRKFLLGRLIHLNEDEMDSENTGRKLAIRSLTRLISDTGPSDPIDNPVIGVLEEHLESIVAKALSVDAMVSLARDLFQTTDVDKRVATATALFPVLREWDHTQSFRSFYEQIPSEHLAMSEPFGGALFLITDPPTVVLEEDIAYDDDGHSVPYRMALYTCEVLHLSLPHLSAKDAAKILAFLCVSQQIVNSQQKSGDRNLMYSTHSDHVDAFDARLRDILLTVVGNSNDWRRNTNQSSTTNDTTEALSGLIKILLDQSRQTNALAYYSGVALSNVLSTIVSVNGLAFDHNEVWLQDQKLFTKELSSPFATLAILTGFGEALRTSDTIKWFCNQLFSAIYVISGPLFPIPYGVSGPRYKSKADAVRAGAFNHSSTLVRTALYAAVMLNGCLCVYEESGIPVQTIRMAKSVNQMISWTDGQDFSTAEFAVASEVCRALTKILPVLKTSSGEHWNLIIQKLCLSPWDMYTAEPEGVPFVLACSSLRLYSQIVKFKDDDDASVELQDLFLNQHTALNEGLLRLMKVPRLSKTPLLATFDAYLTPQLLKIPVQEIDPEDIYPLIGSNSEAIQAAAFEILSRVLPKLVEDMTVNVMVDRKAAVLPLELLSLLMSGALQAREISSTRMDLSDQVQHARRSVLLAWKLVLQWLGLAPYKIRMELSEKLEEVDELNPLLDFIYRTFSSKDTKDTKMRPMAIHFQLGKDLIRNYDVWDLDHSLGLLHSVHWLAAHVYFLALKYVPHLVKSWHINHSRGGKAFMHEWTDRHFTSLVLEDSIQEVRVWRGESEAKDTEDGKHLIVKLPAKQGNTVTVSYEIDDQVCSISLTIPSSYPLNSIEVASISRVAVPPKQWESVLKQIEGAIRFHGGHIIDGIELFRQNVSKFLDGHEPCSICYSIVSEDMRLPEKGCATCRNMFHVKCISKWFKTSNASSCPMCRQPWADLARR